VSRDAFSLDPPDARDTESGPPDTGRETRSASAARAALSDSRQPNTADLRDFSRQRDRLRYFTIRKAWDLREYVSLSEGDLIFRNFAKQRFSANALNTFIGLGKQDVWRNLRFGASWREAKCPT